jgi:hypothetical protein
MTFVFRRTARLKSYPAIRFRGTGLVFAGSNLSSACDSVLGGMRRSMISVTIKMERSWGAASDELEVNPPLPT